MDGVTHNKVTDTSFGFTTLYAILTNGKSDTGVFTALSTVNIDGEECAVLGISGGSFEGNTSITSIEAPSVTDIGNIAFKGCTVLEKVDLPMATKMGQQAFAVCESLSKVSIS